MDLHLETYSDYASQNIWGAIIPEIALVCLALAILFLHIALPKERRGHIVPIALIGQLVILGMLYLFSPVRLHPEIFLGQSNFAGMLKHTLTGELARGLILVCSIFSCQLGVIYLQRQKLPATEFLHLILIAAAGLMLLVQSNHFIMLFVALETASISFFGLISYCRRDSYSLEAGLRYLILAGASSAFLLFGMTLLYGAGGNPNFLASQGDTFAFPELELFIKANSENPIVLLGVLLTLSGVAFKIGIAPFHVWIPTVYQGAPTPITAFLATASKAAGFFVLLNLLHGPFSALQSYLTPVLTVAAILTMLIGNITALGQRNVKRIMGLSGVAHAGYLLVAVVASFTYPQVLAGIIVFYLLVYILASFAVFGVMTLVPTASDSGLSLEDFDDLGRREPFLGGVLAIGLGSLTGIPPLAGFIAKLLVFYFALKAELYLLFGVAAVGVVISIYYYFGWIMAALFRSLRLREPASSATSVATPQMQTQVKIQRSILGVLSIGTIWFGLHQGLLTFLFNLG